MDEHRSDSSQVHSVPVLRQESLNRGPDHNDMTGAQNIELVFLPVSRPRQNRGY